jgi:hypothetical protein
MASSAAAATGMVLTAASWSGDGLIVAEAARARERRGNISMNDIKARCDMKRIIMLGDTTSSRDPRTRFGTAWVAAFLGLVLILGAVFWAIAALP